MNDIFLEGATPSYFLMAKVAVDKTRYDFDILYSYYVPDEIKHKARAGSRVLVSFGRNREKREGLIISIEKTSTYDEKIKNISELIDDSPILNEEMIKLAIFMKNRYFCTLYEAIRAITPVGAKLKTSKKYKIVSQEYVNALLTKEELSVINILTSKKCATLADISKKMVDFDKDKLEKILKKLIEYDIVEEFSESSNAIKSATAIFVEINNQTSPENIKLTEKQRVVYEFLKNKKDISLKELLYFTGMTSAVVKALEKKDVVRLVTRMHYRTPYRDKVEQKIEKITLTEDQQKSFDYLYDKYKSGKPNVSLLFGVTGSGKTSVFMSLIDKAIEDDKGVIVMVPEIALTPQLTRIFRERFGENIAVFHSGLSAGERFDEWRRIKEKKAKIAIGTRSAIFAPLDDIGLIIVDEEQENSYRSESNPKFHARELAKFRCNEHKCLLVLSSATPCVESYYFASNGIYGLTKINKRYGKALLPKVQIVDMNEEESLTEEKEIFSLDLMRAIKDNLENHLQSVILLNRRGHSTFISCCKCGEVLTCPRCSVSMVYHARNNRFMCHYCGFSQQYDTTCPKCGEDSLRVIGCGTQKVQEKLKDLFPKARILRMDADSINSKFSYEENISKFLQGDYDIMIGTQMVSKGLNFPKVTLACILSADQTLYGEDFRSSERAFSLITQTIGRSGRGDDKGIAIIQTYTPENSIIKLASDQNYERFYDSEIEIRRTMLYPPFSDIVVVSFFGSEEAKAKEDSKFFINILKTALNEKYNEIPISIFGPSAASILKVNDEFRYKIIIKCKNSKKFRNMLSEVYIEFLKRAKRPKISIDVNPNVTV